MHRVTSPLRVALYSGIYMKADAISTSVRYKLDVLRRLAGDGVPVEAVVYTHGSDYDDPAVVTVANVHDIARTDDFSAADVHVFEFGICYDLFDTLFIVPEGRAKVAVYHNVTPPHLAHSAAMRETLERSLVQRDNLFLADRVLCISEYNRDDLIDLGIAAERLSVLHLPPAIEPPPHRERDSDTVELLYVGRFVPAKGVLDLVRAFTRAVESGAGPVRLTLAGNPALSSAECMRDIEEMLRAGAVGSMVRIVPSPDQCALANLYACSDALVMPSYHEGYCMPVLEALLSQCHVIAYDAGNLPHVVNGLGTLVPTGDVEALATAIAEFAARSHRSRREGTTMSVPTRHGALPEEEWRRHVTAHLERHSMRAFEVGFTDMLAWAARRAGKHDVARALEAQPTVRTSP